MHLTTVFNLRSEWQRCSSWMQNHDPVKNSLGELLFRASCSLSSLMSMQHLVAVCDAQLVAIRPSLTIRDQKIMVFCPTLLSIFNEFSPFLASIRSMQNLVLQVLGAQLKLSLPSSLAEIEKEKVKKRLPTDLLRIIETYWTEGGKVAKSYRDIDQHFSSLVRVATYRTEFPTGLSVLLPDNPEEKSPRNFTYLHEIDAIQLFHSCYSELHDTYEHIAEYFGYSPKPLTNEIPFGDLGVLREGEERTMAVIIDGYPTSQTFIVDQTPDRRIRIQRGPRLA